MCLNFKGQGRLTGCIAPPFYPPDRRVLVKAFLEIRFMLESNLMRKFTSTDEFKEAQAADKANAVFIGQA